MTPQTDRNFRRENATIVITGSLSKFQKILLIVLALLCVIQLGLIVWNANVCATIYGLSLDGRIFESHSFTCPNPEVEPLYDGEPRISGLATPEKVT